MVTRSSFVLFPESSRLMTAVPRCGSLFRSALTATIRMILTAGWTICTRCASWSSCEEELRAIAWVQEYVPYELAKKLVRPIGKVVCLIRAGPAGSLAWRFLCPQPDERAPLQLGSVATAKVADGQLLFEQAVKQRFDERQSLR